MTKLMVGHHLRVGRTGSPRSESLPFPFPFPFPHPFSWPFGTLANSHHVNLKLPNRTEDGIVSGHGAFPELSSLLPQESHLRRCHSRRCGAPSERSLAYRGNRACKPRRIATKSEFWATENIFPFPMCSVTSRESCKIAARCSWTMHIGPGVTQLCGIVRSQPGTAHF